MIVKKYLGILLDLDGRFSTKTAFFFGINLFGKFSHQVIKQIISKKIPIEKLKSNFKQKSKSEIPI